MKTKHPNMDWQVMDVRELRFSANHFDVAIDKATLDAMLHGSLWDPPADVKKNVRAYVDEVQLPPCSYEVVSRDGFPADGAIDRPSAEAWRQVALYHVATATLHSASAAAA